MTIRHAVALEPAWVLHHRSFRDSSEILDLFTSNHGRIGVVAKGVRQVRKRQRIVPAPFTPLAVSWSGRGELSTLTGVESTGPALQVKGRRLMSMFYVNELILRLVQRHDPHPELFHIYESTLSELAVGEVEASVLRSFEKRLLEELGYGLQLSSDEADGNPIDEDARYEYVLEQGPRKVADDRKGPLIVSGASLLALHEDRLDTKSVLKDAQRLLGAALRLYLGDKPMQTRKVLLEMKERV
ncbi:MAG: DNA repair protein RecO [Gammaproteobacteria bacterium]